MLQAAVKALAEITKKPVPPRVKDFYGEGEIFELSKDYLIPKPNDPRVLVDVSMAIAKAACSERVSKKEMDFDIYQKELLELAEKIHGYSIENLY